MGSRLTFAFSLMYSRINPATCFSTSFIFRLQVRGKCLNIFLFAFTFSGHISEKLARKVWFIVWPFYFTCSGINPVKLIESDSARQMGWFLFTLSRYLDNYFTKTISFWQNKTVIKCYFAQSLPVFSSTGNWPFYFWAHSLNENGIDPLSSLPQ